MKNPPQPPNNKGEGLIFAVCAFVGVGALIGGFIAAWEAGYNYRRREEMREKEEGNQR